MAGCQMQTKWHDGTRRKDAWRTTAFYKLKVLPFTFPLVLMLLALFVFSWCLVGANIVEMVCIWPLDLLLFFSFTSSLVAIVLHYFLSFSFDFFFGWCYALLVRWQKKTSVYPLVVYILLPFHSMKHKLTCVQQKTENKSSMCSACVLRITYIRTSIIEKDTNPQTHTQARSERKMGASKQRISRHRVGALWRRERVWWAKGKSKVIKPIFKLEKMLKLNNI